MGRQTRCKIDDKRRSNSHSHRASKGKLTVSEGHCPYCGHHKILSTINMGKKCSRCKLRIR